MSEFHALFGSLHDLLREYGAPVVGFVLLLESFGFPLPGESLLVTASVLAGRGDVSLPALVLFAWAGAVVGDNIGYLIGRKFGHRILIRLGGKIGLTEPRMAKVEAAFAKYGGATVIFARFFNVLRQLNGIVAGSLEMGWWRFLFFNALGAALWTGLWTSAGYYFGAHGRDVAALAKQLGFAGAAIAAVAVIAVAIYLWGTRRP